MSTPYTLSSHCRRFLANLSYYTQYKHPLIALQSTQQARPQRNHLDGVVYSKYRGLGACKRSSRAHSKIESLSRTAGRAARTAARTPPSPPRRQRAAFAHTRLPAITSHSAAFMTGPGRSYATKREYGIERGWQSPPAKTPPYACSHKAVRPQRWPLHALSSLAHPSPHAQHPLPTCNPPPLPPILSTAARTSSSLLPSMSAQATRLVCGAVRRM